MSDEIRRFTFRLPLETFESIDKVAKSNRRSVNSEIIIAIEDYLQKFQPSSISPSKQESE